MVRVLRNSIRLEIVYFFSIFPSGIVVASGT